MKEIGSVRFWFSLARARTFRITIYNATTNIQLYKPMPVMFYSAEHRGVAMAKILGGPSDVTLHHKNYDVTVANLPQKNIGGGGVPPWRPPG